MNMRVLISLCAGTYLMPAVFGQHAVYPPPKLSPAKIEKQIVLLDESVVGKQWTRTLDLVNLPMPRTRLNPGQCVRVGVLATGDNRDTYLSQTKLSFTVKLASHVDPRGSALMVQFKKIKLDGGDFVAAALAVGGVKVPDAMRTVASLGVSEANWCVPTNTKDGTAGVDVTIDAPDGRHVSASSTVDIESFATGRRKKFKDLQEYGQFLQTYYRQPNPSRLLPAIEFMVEEQTKQPRPGQTEIVGAFVSAALKADPVAARHFLSEIGAQPALVRAFGLLALRSAGYDIEPVVRELSAEDQAKFRTLPDLEDPFDLSATQALFHHLDMLWGVFGATGQYEPVKAIASALAWRSDYEAFAKIKRDPKRSTEITPSIMRGVTYTAAGWSLQSLQMQDGLVADYIDYMLSSQEIPLAIKKELGGLSTNPAFKGR